jgi:hypothetical protein
MPEKRLSVRVVAAAAALLLLAGPVAEVFAWGFTAHRMVNRKAIATLPAPLRAFFTANADYLVEHAIDPDLWRTAGKAGEDPNHYLDMDAFGAFPFPDIARDEARHVARFGKEAQERGRVPWRVAEAYRDLTAAYSAQDPRQVLVAAAVLGHYVGDSHVPLHAALNHDGQLTGQTGLHARWERWLVERYERQFEAAVQPAAARRLGDPVEVTFGALLSSWAAVPGQLAADREAVAGARDLAATPEDDRYGDLYYSKLYEIEGDRVVARIAAAAETLGSLWYSAYEDAGRPDLDWSYRLSQVRRQHRLIVLTFAGADSLGIEAALAQGSLANLRHLRTEGVSGTIAPAETPAPASHYASLVTGASAATTGVGDASDSTALRAEPLWVAAARQGLEVTTLAVPLTLPAAPYEQDRRFGGNFGRSLNLLRFEPRPGGSILFYKGDELVGNKPPLVLDAAKALKTIEMSPAGTLQALTTWAVQRTRAEVLVAHQAVAAEAARVADEAVGNARRLDGDAVIALVFLPTAGGSAGTFVASGPGVVAGVDLGRLRAIDLAPTILALAGLDPPANAEGSAIAAALAPSSTGDPGRR